MNAPESPLPLQAVNWCAGKIADPVHRLRFLKLAARLPNPRRRTAVRRFSYLAGSVAVGIVAMLAWTFARDPAPTVSGGAPLISALPVTADPASVSAVWPVEKSSSYEIFSNGLRIENRYSVNTAPRSYLAFRASEPLDTEGVRRSEPAGIVYHTTESHQAPFDSEQNGVLKMIGESMLDYVRRIAAYNFVIDRFGRVYRIVPEDQVANHAGYSVWSDEKWVYLNLNASFIGVSFEAETSHNDINSAQTHAASILTAMLRSRYAIPAESCVTHAQVSVNPANMQVGYHTDWGSSFPFEQLGLPDNYARALPAVSLFGFGRDAVFARAAGERLSGSAALAEERIRVAAQASGVPLDRYRKRLHERYREKIAAMQRDAP